MISVGDGRNYLGLGFGGEAKMGKSSLEKGKGYYYRNDDDNSFVDLDISLSYIDEKLQDVLGHFQKDFEGEVSAENLGAKFGGYGSFLPAYRRSPVLQQPQTPQKIHGFNKPTSQNIPQLEASERSSKVRINLGSDNLSTRRNAEIYKGLGLDISPSMSADALGNERSCQLFYLPEESPTSILQIMTSFPVNGNPLLSPLPHDLIYFSEKHKFQEESKHKSSRQVSDVKHSDRGKGGNKHKFSTKNDVPVELKNHVKKNSQSGNVFILKKKRHGGQLAERGLVQDSRIGKKVKRDCSSDTVKGEIVEAGSTCLIGSVDLPSGHGRSGMVFEEGKVNPRNDITVYPRKNSHLKGERTAVSVSAKSEVCYGKKAPKTELVDRSELNATSAEEDMSASGSKKKSEGSRSQVVHNAEVAKESLNTDASLVIKGRKSAHVNIILRKSELEDSKPQKNLVKVRDTYRDFFGDAESDQDDDAVDSQSIILNDSAGEFDGVEKSTSKIPPKDYSCGKKRDKPYMKEKNPIAAPTKAPIARNGPVSESVARTGALTPLVKEDWVACDKCQKWRLLPFGTNPDYLPRKWLCSMLYWLPGMNRCSFSEAETTKALIASGQPSAPSGGPYDPPLIDANFFEKKKEGNGVSASVNQGSTGSNCGKNNLQTSVTHCSLNAVNRSPLVPEIETRLLRKSGVLEKHQYKQKERKEPHEQNSRMRGEIKRKRDDEPGNPVSKKANVDDDGMLDHDRTLGKVEPTSISCLPLIAAGMNRHKNVNHLTRDRKRNVNNKSEDPFRNSHEQSTTRKRKMCESPLVQTGDLLEAACKYDDRNEKGATVPKSVATKETSISRGSGGSKQRRSIKDRQFVPDLGMESRKRNLGSVQPSEATSNSSKISGTHNKITISKEAKGPPVESVSSSLLRFLNQHYSVSKKRSLDGKDDSGKVSLGSNNKNGNSQTQLDESELQVLNSFVESIDHLTSDEKKRALKNSVREQFGIGSHVVEPAFHVGNDKYKIVAENGKRDNKYIYRGINRLDDKVDKSSQDQKQNLRPDRDEISSKRLLSHDLRLSSRGQKKTEARPLRLDSGAENEAKSSVIDVAIGGDTLKALKPTRRPEKQCGDQPCKSTFITFNGYNIKDVDSPGPARRDYPSQAGISAVKEGKRLKHLADDLKNSRSDVESTSFYFQTALKSLHAAYLLESCNREIFKRGEMTMSMQVYSNTAKLCEFCAYEYEKSKDYAASALSYKLAEVAYMRVIYSSNTNASKDRHELQTALQVVPLDESPSSSASDVDNLNNPVTIDKASLVNDVGIHNIAARNCAKLAGVLNLAQDVNYAMEASRKSRNAFAAAKSRSKESRGIEGITCVKKALHLNFHNMEKLLKLSRLAMDAISH